MDLKLIKIKNPENEKNLKTGLLKIFDFDEDMNGNNGEEYLWAISRDNGYTSNNEYLADIAISKEPIPEEAIERFAKEFYASNSHYYTDYELEMLRENDTLFVAFAIESHV